MAFTYEAEPYQGDGFYMDYLSGVDLLPMTIIGFGAGTDRLVGVNPRQLTANTKLHDAVEMQMGYRVRKAAGTVFTQGVGNVYWNNDPGDKEAVAIGDVAGDYFKLGVPLADAAADDEFVLVLLNRTIPGAV